MAGTGEQGESASVEASSMDFQPVASPQTESELAVMVSVLEAYGIPHFVLNRGFGGLYPGMKVPLLNGQRILVPAERAAEAKELLSGFDQPEEAVEAEAKLSLADRLRVIAELLIGGWAVPVKRRRPDDDPDA